MALKSLAYWLTGSIGLLSDAIESLVNLVGACMALAMLIIAASPADEGHLYGHSKAEYFSSGVEGTLILLAAISISVAAVQRLLQPQPVTDFGLGMIICTLALAINFGVAWILLAVGKKYNSITLEADANYFCLPTVPTSLAVLGGVGVVAVTDWERLDPIVALLVAANIVWTGYRLVQRSMAMDAALLPTSSRKSAACWPSTKQNGSSSMRCGPGRPPPDDSYPCMCLFPVAG